MTDMRFIYITTKDFTEAQVLAERALKERVAACANILPQMESMYWWQGAIHRTPECVLILKTDVHHVDATMKLIKHYHSFGSPCIVSLAVDAGDENYLKWLSGELTAPK